MSKDINIIVRPLTFEDLSAIEILDDISGNNVQQWFESEDDYSENYAYGIFSGVDNTANLIGYCTIGGADDAGKMIENHKDYNYDSLMLSDVYITNTYRKKGYAKYLLDEAISQKLAAEPADSIYLTLLYDSLGNFYEKLGFKWCDDSKIYAMVLSGEDINKYKPDPQEEIER